MIYLSICRSADSEIGKIGGALYEPYNDKDYKLSENRSQDYEFIYLNNLPRHLFPPQCPQVWVWICGHSD